MQVCHRRRWWSLVPSIFGSRNQCGVVPFFGSEELPLAPHSQGPHPHDLTTELWVCVGGRRGEDLNEGILQLTS